METLIDVARRGTLPSAIRSVARREHMSAEELRRLIATGKAVVPYNRANRLTRPCAIGKGLRVKINANLGTSPEQIDLKAEICKLKTAVAFGADAVMDLSTGGDLRHIRQALRKICPVPLGTVPVYEAAVASARRTGSWEGMTREDILDVLRDQAQSGVDFFTIHSGVTRRTLAVLARQPRALGIVSRGGALLANWIRRNKKENPFFEYFDDILDIARQFDVTLSLGDGLRPGSVLDATDRAQIAELKVLGVLARRAWRRGVQVMIEGPGHVPLHQVARNIRLEKKYCHGAPFYVLGPLVTDSAIGYDHIAAAIGATVAAANGADFLCFVTPAEHVRLPDADDVKLGVIASRIAAHSADLARGMPQAWKRDRAMSAARKARDWNVQAQLAFDPEKIRAERARSQPHIRDVCTMCGEFCSIKLQEKKTRA